MGGPQQSEPMDVIATSGTSAVGGSLPTARGCQRGHGREDKEPDDLHHFTFTILPPTSVLTRLIGVKSSRQRPPSILAPR